MSAVLIQAKVLMDSTEYACDNCKAVRRQPGIFRPPPSWYCLTHEEKSEHLCSRDCLEEWAL
jgi:hypothetical protein